MKSKFFKLNTVRVIFFLIGAIPITILFFGAASEFTVDLMENNAMRIYYYNEIKFINKLNNTINSLLEQKLNFFNLAFVKFPYLLIGFPMIALAVFFCGDFDECSDAGNLFISVISYIIALIITWCFALILEAICNFIIKIFRRFFQKIK